MLAFRLRTTDGVYNGQICPFAGTQKFLKFPKKSACEKGLNKPRNGQVTDTC